MKTYTQRRNLNRGYMKLEVWQLGMDLFRFMQETLEIVKPELRLRSQLADATMSIAANISEGYCRRSVREYMYFVNVSLGSLGEVMTRIVALRDGGAVPEDRFEAFDALHFEPENKLLALLKSLQAKARTESWETELTTDGAKPETGSDLIPEIP